MFCQQSLRFITVLYLLYEENGIADYFDVTVLDNQHCNFIEVRYESRVAMGTVYQLNQASAYAASRLLAWRGGGKGNDESSAMSHALELAVAR